MGYAIRLPANRVLQDKIGYLLKRPVGRPPHEVRRYYASFRYQAQSWAKPRRVVAKVEWHPGELYPRVGFVVTNLARPAERVIAFYNCNRAEPMPELARKRADGAIDRSTTRDIPLDPLAADGRSNVGTRVAETILASVQVRARQQAGHMDASDLIREHCRNTLARRGPSTYGSKRARARSSGRGCHAIPSPPTPSGFNCTRWPTTSAIS
jgi:hypothetical protein